MESNLALTPSKVAELIDSNTRKWRTESIHNTFTEGDAERILYIPLSMNAHKDHIAIQLGLTLGLLGVVIEGDAHSVISKLQADYRGNQEEGDNLSDECFPSFAVEEVDVDRRWTESLNKRR
ncbi:hypothetical protein Golob_027563 [Gossypium lobatum]|uniref:RNase H type-1 domain-containing protein n=1 Tax=Gossypium lobatum TaxID=34289 RepID=A0A7J8NDZ5_9ROSI|nr:hypothetical protein [Gossypium lobatum]